MVVNGSVPDMSRLAPASIDLPTLAALAGNAVSEHLLAELRAAGHAGVRASHGYIFQLLIDGPKAVGELAPLLGVTQQAASKAVLELEALGYIERRADGDNRVKRIALSARGRAVIRDSRQFRAKLEARIVDVVGARAVASARSALLALLEETSGLDSVARRRVRPPADEIRAEQRRSHRLRR
jgi:DNA-binding MarR family transcriptional regulator